MSDDTQPQGQQAVYTGDQPNAILGFLQQPRILLLLLAIWSILGVLTEVFTESGLFVDRKGGELDGALGGFAFGWEGIPLAVLYIYCFRNPKRYPRIFWLAFIHMAALALAQPYQLIVGTFSAESIIVPFAGSAGLGLLSFANIFQPRTEEGEVAQTKDD